MYYIVQHKKKLTYGKGAQKKPWGLWDLVITRKKHITERVYVV